MPASHLCGSGHSHFYQTFERLFRTLEQSLDQLKIEDLEEVSSNEVKIMSYFALFGFVGDGDEIGIPPIVLFPPELVREM